VRRLVFHGTPRIDTVRNWAIPSCAQQRVSDALPETGHDPHTALLPHVAAAPASPTR